MLRIVQITDTHISEMPEKRQRRLPALARTVDFINTLAPTPALIIHTGDAADTGQESEYALLRAEMDRLDAPCVITPGNRDSRARMRAAFADMPWVDENEGPLDFVIEVGPLAIIGFDSKGQRTNKGWADEERRGHLRAMLQRTKDRPVLLMMHHPPFEIPEIPDPRQFADWSQAEAVCALVGEYPNVQALACGHIHRHITGFHVAHAPAFVLPCIAPDLRKGPARELGDAVAVMCIDFDDEGRLQRIHMTMDTAPAAAAE